jgi:hypothetical protein
VRPRARSVTKTRARLPFVAALRRRRLRLFVRADRLGEQVGVQEVVRLGESPADLLAAIRLASASARPWYRSATSAISCTARAKVRNLRQFSPLFAAHTHRCARMWTRIFAATSTGEGGRSATEKARHDWRGLLCHCRVRCICGRDRRTLIRPAQLHLGSILNYGHERERAGRRVHATDVWLHFNALTLDAGVRWTLLAGPACASLCAKRLGPERALSSRASGPRTGGPAAGRWQAGGPPCSAALVEVGLTAAPG